MSRINFSAYKLVNYPFSWAAGLGDLGFDGWEIVSEGKQKITAETLPEIRDIVNSTKLHVTVHGPFSDLNLASLNDPIWNETIRQIQECVELSAELTDIVVVHPGALSPLGNQMPDKAWDRNVEGLRILCDHSKDYGVKLCLENMPNMEKLFCRTPDELLGMVESVDRENMGITFDAGHANTTKNTGRFTREWKRISHAHIHDNNGVRDEHLEIGKGTVDWDGFLKEMRSYEGTMVIEGRSIEEGGRSLEYIKKAVHY
ncbi:MAG TPA: sugar phosphate isomerase/epimerase family protein [Methanocella sp.]|nr:sugar phosphate isomerase/epimerase family protein [Methanocella sp.]